MHVEYVFRGENIQEKDVERAIELSLTRYCGVTAMFQKAMTVTHSYRIEREDGNK
jgi:putative redox protein